MVWNGTITFLHFERLVLSLEERLAQASGVLKLHIDNCQPFGGMGSGTAQDIKKNDKKCKNVLQNQNMIPVHAWLSIRSLPVHSTVKTPRSKMSSQYTGRSTNNTYHAVYPKYTSNDICTSGFIPNLSWSSIPTISNNRLCCMCFPIWMSWRQLIEVQILNSGQEPCQPVNRWNKSNINNFRTNSAGPCSWISIISKSLGRTAEGMKLTLADWFEMGLLPMGEFSSFNAGNPAIHQHIQRALFC